MTDRTDRPPRLLLPTLAVVAFTYAFQQTAVIPAIQTIEHSLHATSAWSVWLLSGYLMVATVLTPTLGRLADLHGEATILVVSMGVFLVGSAGAASAPYLPAVLVFRGAQGAGGAVLPLSFAISRRHLPDERVGGAIAALMAAFGLGATVGFGTGGLMAQQVSWRLIFAAGAVLVAVGAVAAFVVLPRTGGSGQGEFDLGGAIWLAGASLGVLLALTLGQQAGWTSPLTVALLASSAASAAAWVRTEMRHRYPLMDLRVLRDRAVMLVNGATVGLGWGRFVGLLLIPQLVQGPGHGRYGFGFDATVAGLYLVPDGVGTVLGGPIAGRLSGRVRPGAAFAAALAVMSAGLVVLATAGDEPPAVLVSALLLGLGGGAATQASSAVTTADVPAGDAAASSALNSTVRRFTGGVGDQVSVVVLGSLAGAGATASRSGFVVVFAVAAGLTAAGTVCCVALPGRGRE